MAQRATYSDYKSNNTIKYLVVISPAGATVYVSTGFPGRISDPQICYACATFGGYSDRCMKDKKVMNFASWSVRNTICLSELDYRSGF